MLTSGLHSATYWEKFRILENPSYTERLCQLIAEHFKGEEISLVAGPTTGGIILAHEVGRQLGKCAIYAEKEGNIRTFRRGLSISAGERVLVVDDVLTTGKSIREVTSAVKKQGGKVIGIGVLVDRSEDNPDFGAPLFSTLKVETPTYKPEECPLCAAGVPITKPGSSHQ